MICKLHPGRLSSCFLQGLLPAVKCKMPLLFLDTKLCCHSYTVVLLHKQCFSQVSAHLISGWFQFFFNFDGSLCQHSHSLKYPRLHTCLVCTLLSLSLAFPNSYFLERINQSNPLSLRGWAQRAGEWARIMVIIWMRKGTQWDAQSNRKI